MIERHPRELSEESKQRYPPIEVGPMLLVFQLPTVYLVPLGNDGQRHGGPGMTSRTDRLRGMIEQHFPRQGEDRSPTKMLEIPFSLVPVCCAESDRSPVPEAKLTA